MRPTRSNVQRSPSTRSTGPSRIVSLLLVAWLVIGAFAAYQRDYFDRGDSSCAKVSTVGLTVLAGPLNYLGANPRIKECNAPQPSK